MIVSPVTIKVKWPQTRTNKKYGIAINNIFEERGLRPYFHLGAQNRKGMGGVAFPLTLLHGEVAI